MTVPIILGTMSLFSSKMSKMPPKRLVARRQAPAPVFIDVFAGCGGLSLGLMKAGWRGLFGIEKDRFAFDTLKSNLANKGCQYSYDWPTWLEKSPWDIENLFDKHSNELHALKGEIDLLAGGPPCQGFSYAGQRKFNDPRNELVERYLSLVDILEPRILLLENVRGFTSDFKSDDKEKLVNFSSVLIKRLKKKYWVSTALLQSSQFGIPQSRSRFFLIAFLKSTSAAKPRKSPFAVLRARRADFLRSKGIPQKTSSKSAISDLELFRNGKKGCPDTKNFEAIAYKQPRTAFQRAMRDSCEKHPGDTRLARHRPAIKLRFEAIINECKKKERLNVSLSSEMRKKYGLKKMALRVLDPKRPSPTLTSMPDDLLHYNEPRTLTVRENARLQTFPDWFTFKGKYTTGGKLRRQEVPRFTQVANAVPPLLAEQLGDILMDYCLINY